MIDLDEIEALVESRQVAFKDMAGRLANNETVPPDEVVKILEAAGKSTTDLRLVISSIQSWERKSADFARLPVVSQELQQCRAQVEFANQTLEVAVAEHQATTAPLQSRIWDLQLEENRLNQLGNEMEACRTRRHTSLSVGTDSPSTLRTAPSNSHGWQKL